MDLISIKRQGDYRDDIAECGGERMLYARIRVSGSEAESIVQREIPHGIIGAKVRFDFDPEWEGRSRTVVFQTENLTKDVVLTGSEDVVTVPAEVTAVPCKSLRVGVYGTAGDGTTLPTLWVELGRVYYAADPSGDETTDPSLPVWAQLQQQVDDLKQQGPGHGGNVDLTGYATEEWVRDQDYLDSSELHAAVNNALALAKESGQFDGKDGRDGVDGKDYVLTDADKEEIAEMAAELVDVPDSGGNVDFRTDETLKLENGILSVNTTNDVEQDNTLPITSAGVFATVGNIEALLKTI